MILPELQRYLWVGRTRKREARLRAEYPNKSKPEGWGTNDPKFHDPENFRYIVHTTSIERLDNGVWLRSARNLGPKRKYEGNPWNVLIGDFISHDSISCTLVDEVHRGTYLQDTNPHGFILDVPEENIIALAPGDLGTPDTMTSREHRLRILRDGIERREKTPSAQAFFNDGVADVRNEVLVDGIGIRGRQIRISGVFVITDPILGIPLYDLPVSNRWEPDIILRQIFNPWGNEVSDIIRDRRRLHKEAKDLAKFLAIPLVYIPGYFR